MEFPGQISAEINRMITLGISLVVSIPLELHVLGPDLSVLAPFINIALALGLPVFLYRCLPTCRTSGIETISTAS